MDPDLHRRMVAEHWQTKLRLPQHPMVAVNVQRTSLMYRYLYEVRTVVYRAFLFPREPGQRFFQSPCVERQWHT